MHSAIVLLAGLLPALASALQQIPLQASSPPSASTSHAGESLVRIAWNERPGHRLQRYLDTRYDVWHASAQHTDLRLATQAGQHELLERLGGSANVSVLYDDIASLLESQADEALAVPTEDIHAIYHNLDGIDSLLHLIAADHASLAKLVHVGTSYEGRDILGLRVGRKAKRKAKKGRESKGKGKATILIVGGQHAREWITPAATLYMAHALLLEASQSKPPKHLHQLLEAFDFVFVPTLNPDGYEYSWATDRLWRKSRQPSSADCYGIDLNHNYGFRWSADRAVDPCAESHPGNASFEAAEVHALRRFVRHLEHEPRALLDLHSFGETLMYPYAYDCSKTPRHAEDLIEAAYGAARAAKSQYGVVYEVGSVCQASYPSTGQLIDWAYGEAKIKWAYSANLRDSGVHGFLLPASQIRPAGEEALAMLLSIAEFIRVKEKR